MVNAQLAVFLGTKLIWCLPVCVLDLLTANKLPGGLFELLLTCRICELVTQELQDQPWLEQPWQEPCCLHQAPLKVWCASTGVCLPTLVRSVAADTADRQGYIEINVKNYEC